MHLAGLVRHYRARKQNFRQSALALLTSRHGQNDSWQIQELPYQVGKRYQKHAEIFQKAGTDTPLWTISRHSPDLQIVYSTEGRKERLAAASVINGQPPVTTAKPFLKAIRIEAHMGVCAGPVLAIGSCYKQ
jgi:hypothetical protein